MFIVFCQQSNTSFQITSSVVNNIFFGRGNKEILVFLIVLAKISRQTCRLTFLCDTVCNKKICLQFFWLYVNTVQPFCLYSWYTWIIFYSLSLSVYSSFLFCFLLAIFYLDMSSLVLQAGNLRGWSFLFFWRQLGTLMTLQLCELKEISRWING